MSCAPPRRQPPACAAQGLPRRSRAVSTMTKRAARISPRSTAWLVCPRSAGTGASARRFAQHNDHEPPPAPAVTRCGVALVPRCSFPAPRAVLPSAPEGLPSPVLRRALLRRLRHGRQAAAPQGNAKARSASGASRHVALHRTCTACLIPRHQGSAAPLRALDGASAEEARPDPGR